MRSKALRWPHSLRARLLVIYALGMSLSVVLVGATTMVLAEPFHRFMLRHATGDAAEALARCVLFDPQGRPTGFDETKIERWLLTTFGDEAQIRIIDAQGRVVFSPVPGDATVFHGEGDLGRGTRSFAFERNGVAMHGAASEILRGGPRWYVYFAGSDRLMVQMRETFSQPALFQGMLAVGLTFLAVFLVATHLTLQRMLRPLSVAARHARRITPQSLDARLAGDDLPVEIKPLIDAFNDALNRLQTGYQAQQEFLANAAHELKTPLALMRAEIEQDPPEARNPNLLEDIDRMGRQVQQLLHLAEASEARNYAMEAVEPLTAVAEVCSYMERAAQLHGVQIVATAEHREDGALPPAGPLRWRADRGALFTLMKNLLENAMQHSPPGGTVAVHMGHDGFTVTDEGPGVASSELDRLFERFWRGEARRDIGAGLGLSICTEIARNHGWTIEARRGDVGLRMEVGFGLQPTDAAGPGQRNVRAADTFPAPR